MTVQAAFLPDGKRLHLQHGPIDLIIAVDGEPADRRRAFLAARSRFDGLLDRLVEELVLLRAEVPCDGLDLQGPVARRMQRAVQPHWRERVTPMAAVAGAVADEVLAAMLKAAPLRRAYVNNGGDIALHLARGQSFSITSSNGPVHVMAGSGVGGIATSGWRGRSYSLGIADSVSVLAHTAAQADVAATLIANAVDLPGSASIRRVPASELNPDSDLGEREVTVAVGALSRDETARALSAGLDTARKFHGSGLIKAATLGLNGHTVAIDVAQPAGRMAVHA